MNSYTGHNHLRLEDLIMLILSASAYTSLTSDFGVRPPPPQPQSLLSELVNLFHVKLPCCN